jgi:hypothetical protein
MVAVERQRAEGDGVLLIVGSDHGHETVSGVVDVEACLIAAGLKAGPDSTDVLALSNGTASLIYLHPDQENRRALLADYLQSQPWIGRCIAAEDLNTIGQAPLYGLAFAVSLRADTGCSLIAVPRWEKPIRPGCGQHGGLGQFEQAPVLMIEGEGFEGGSPRSEGASIVDLAPTISRHLGLPGGNMDGRVLQL